MKKGEKKKETEEESPPTQKRRACSSPSLPSKMIPNAILPGFSGLYFIFLQKGQYRAKKTIPNAILPGLSGLYFIFLQKGQYKANSWRIFMMHRWCKNLREFILIGRQWDFPNLPLKNSLYFIF